jgi:hypothetical protein
MAVEQKQVASEYFVDNPKYTSINQRKDEERRDARKKAGLEQIRSDVKIAKEPSLSYQAHPAVGSKTLLDNQRKSEMLNELQKLDGNYTSFQDKKARLEERVNCQLRLGYKQSAGKTYKQIEEERKKTMIDNMTTKFGSVTVGIHGQELPTFSGDESVKEWWKQKPAYKEEPPYQSAVELKEN